MLQLHAIQKACVWSSGLKGIALIDPGDLLVQPVWHHIPSIESLQFKPGRAAFDISHRLISGMIQDKTDLNSAGDTYSYNVSADLSMVRLEVDYLRAKFRNRKLHVLCTNMDDTQRLVPNAQLGMDGSSGNNSNRNGYNLSGSTVLTKPAPWINQTVSVIGGPYIPPTTPGGGGGTPEFTPTLITTTNTDFMYTLPAGKFLMAIFVRSTNDQVMAIGYSAGANELGGPLEMMAGSKYQFGDNWLYPDVPVNIYFSGLLGTNTIEICVL